MVTALIVAAAAASLILAAIAVTVLTGWFPRLAAIAVRCLESLFCSGQPTRLTPRERSELVARLWVP